MLRRTIRRFGQTLRLGVASDGLALVRVNRLFGGAPVLLAEQRLDLFAPDALALGLRALFADHAPAGWTVSVVLADELIRLWQVTPPQGATRMGDLEGAATLRFQHLFGAAPAEWVIRADWDAARPFLASAAPLNLLDGLMLAADAHRFHLVELKPQFVASLNRWRQARRPGAWFGQVHGGVLSLAAYDGATLAAVRSSPIPAGADRDWLEAHVAREALRVGVGRPERLQLCGAAPAAWGSSPGRLKFACSLFEDNAGDGWSDLARLARTGAAT
ncbi:hypothetical protein AB2N08_18005 [Massilia aurea]|uniref:hypothetical protein n=1 Tax=Massilia aurea TaxID=373040 RepID=UPI0034629BA2